MEKARRALAAAELLHREGHADAAVSRAYYAMFYAPEAILAARGLSASSHRGVIALFGEEFVKKGILPKHLGRDLSRAFDKRQESDYELDRQATRAQSETTVATARDFLDAIASALEQFPPPHA